ncbi:MAG TPA: hypothetical protein VGG69_10295 [Rhizomicrobium sp.]
MTDLSIKNVPAAEVEKLRKRARRNQRSLQGELRTILSAVLATPETERRERPLTFEEALAEIRKVPLETPAESVPMIREDRDGR